MAVKMIPDPAGREAAFEPLLDELLAVLLPGWEMPPGPATTENRLQRYRNEIKRFRIGEAADQDLAATRRHADLLVRAAMHDQCRSGVRQLIGPLVCALGHRPVQAAIVDYMRAGTDAERVGAAMAWPWANPGLEYASMEDLRRGVPTPESRAALDTLRDLRADYRAACLAAFLACDDPVTRRDLSFGLHLDPAAYPEELRNSHEKAVGIVRADPGRYAWLLQSCSHELR